MLSEITLSSDITNGLGDIDPEWAPNPEELPRWFVDALAVPRDEGFVEVDGTRIHYFRWGRRGAPPEIVDPDRKSTRLNPVTNAHLVCRLLLAKKKKNIRK